MNDEINNSGMFLNFLDNEILECGMFLEIQSKKIWISWTLKNELEF